MKRLLVNVLEQDECRVAIVDEGTLLEYYLEETRERSLLGNVYLGRVVNVEPGIQAAFVDIGESKSAFVHVSDVIPAYAGADGIPFERFQDRFDADRKVLIQSILRKGQTVLVQVSKDSIGHKGPTATCYVSLPGRYLVFLAGMGRTGVSKKIEDADQRDRLRKMAESLPAVDYIGVIVRTAGADQPKKDLERDLRYLKQVWLGIVKRAKTDAAPCLLYQESDLVIRTVRDLFDPEVEEILVDSEPVAQQVREFLHSVMPKFANRVHCYSSETPLFYRFNVEKEIDNIYDRKVPLPSGGSLVIDETEALVAIDVNSGRYRKEDDLEKTAVLINSEAAREIARQLRLRDLGGVVICDFIDMVEAKNRRQIEQVLRDQVRRDRSKTWLSRMSRFGIIEMTRQRLRPSKDRVAREVCPTCHGRGTIRSARSVATGIFRQLRRGLHDRVNQEAVVTVGNDVLEILVNQKRADLLELETKAGKKIVIKPDARFGNEEYSVQFR
ncbi:MAG: ribonuclease E/G [Planctomycetota bacterium]